MTVDAMDVQTVGEESAITYQQLTDMEREFDEVETDIRKWQKLCYPWPRPLSVIPGAPTRKRPRRQR